MMLGEKIIEMKPLSLLQVRELLEARKGEKDLTYEQDVTLKYAKKFAKLSPAKAEKLLAELKEVPSVDDEFAIKICDIMPGSKEVLELLVPKGLSFDAANSGKVLEIVAKYAK